MTSTANPVKWNRSISQKYFIPTRLWR